MQATADEAASIQEASTCQEIPRFERTATCGIELNVVYNSVYALPCKALCIISFVCVGICNCLGRCERFDSLSSVSLELLLHGVVAKLCRDVFIAVWGKLVFFPGLPLTVLGASAAKQLDGPR